MPTTNAPITVMIVDPYTLMRDGLRFKIDESGEFDCVGSFADYGSVLAVSRKLAPDIALISTNENDASAFDVVQELMHEVPQTGVIIVPRTVCDVDLRRALDAEVPGLLHQASRFEDICDAMRAVYAGSCYYAADFLDRLDPSVQAFKPSKSIKTRSDTLSPREQQLMVVLALGKSLKKACEELEISYKTADKQKVSLMKKLNIHDRVSLARFAIREGIVDL